MHGLAETPDRAHRPRAGRQRFDTSPRAAGALLARPVQRLAVVLVREAAGRRPARPRTSSRSTAHVGEAVCSRTSARVPGAAPGTGARCISTRASSGCTPAPPGCPRVGAAPPPAWHARHAGQRRPARSRTVVPGTALRRTVPLVRGRARVEHQAARHRVGHRARHSGRRRCAGPIAQFRPAAGPGQTQRVLAGEPTCVDRGPRPSLAGKRRWPAPKLVASFQPAVGDLELVAARRA